MPRPAIAHESVVTAASATFAPLSAGMAEAAEQKSPVFVEHGLAQDFVSKLREAAKTLDASLGARDSTRRRRVTATAALKDQLRRGQRALRLLNAILSPKLASNPDLLAAWDNVRRIKPAPSVASTTEAPAEPVVKAA